GSRSLVVDGATGFLVSAKDQTLFSERIATLVNAEELRLRMGAHALQRSHEFIWDSVLSGLLASYFDVAEEIETIVMSTKPLRPLGLRPGRAEVLSGSCR